MTFTAAVLWTWLRALLVVAMAWPGVLLLERWLAMSEGRTRILRWSVLLLSFLFPELLIGYAYAPWGAGLPWPAEIMTALLLVVRVIPVGIVARVLTPATLITRSAIYCRRMQLKTWRDRRELWWLWLCGPARQATPAILLMGLMAFQEFELAALLKTTSWIDWLFVQQVGGLSLRESLRVSLLPVVMQAVLIGIAVAAVNRTPVDTTSNEDRVPGLRSSLAVWMLIGLMWGLVIIVPTGSLIAGLPLGLWQLVGQPSRSLGLLRELLTGLAIAGVAASAAWITVGWLLPHVRRTGLLVLCCLPGLLGSLILGLGVIAIFQWPGLSLIYATPARWLLGAWLALLPRALLLRLWLQQRSSSGQHVALLLADSPCADQRRQGRRLVWRMIDQPIALALGLLTYWSYLDLTTAYLLAPNGLPSGMVRLYNFMHFGRTSALSAEALVLIVGPLGFMTGVWLIWRGVRA